MKSKLIVIEGIDGSGKNTQVQALFNYLKSKKVKVVKIEYPRYRSFYGKMVKKLLTGKLGDFNQLNPYLAALPYAMDRWQQRDEIVKWLKDGYVVLADRYVTASMAHQAAKLPKKDQPAFIKWIQEMEYKQNGMPKEDLVLVLDIPVSVSQKRLKRKDVSEKNLNHQQKTAELYRRMAKISPHWRLISVVGKDGSWLSRKAIQEKLWQVIK